MLIMKFKKLGSISKKKTSIFGTLTYTHLLVCIFLKHINYSIKSKNAKEKIAKLFSQ